MYNFCDENGFAFNLKESGLPPLLKQANCSPKIMKTLCRTQGLAHDLVVTRKGKITTLWSSKGIRHTVFDSATPHLPGLEYARHMLAVLPFCPEAQSCLVLGLGGGSIPRMLLAALPQIKVEAVEIDPIVVELATRHFGIRELPRLSIHLEDAASFLKHCTARYGIIILDTYLGERFADQCSTQEFIEDARKCLLEDGVLAVNWLGGDLQKREGLLKKLEIIIGPVWQLPGLETRNILFFATARLTTRSAIIAAASTFKDDISFEKLLRRLVPRLRDPK